MIFPCWTLFVDYSHDVLHLVHLFFVSHRYINIRSVKQDNSSWLSHWWRSVIWSLLILPMNHRERIGNVLWCRNLSQREKFELVPPLFLSPISINTLLYHYSNYMYMNVGREHLETAGHTIACRLRSSFFRLYSDWIDFLCSFYSRQCTSSFVVFSK